MITLDSIKKWIIQHKYQLIAIFGFVLYLLTLGLYFTYNPFEFATKSPGLSLFIAILSGMVLLILYFYYEKKRKFFQNEKKTSDMTFFGKILSTALMFGLIAAFVYLIFFIATNFSQATGFILYGVNLLIIIGVIAYLIKVARIDSLLGEPSDKDANIFWKLFKMFLYLVLYIPCAFLDLIEYVKYQYNITAKTTLIIFLIEIILVLIYFVLPIVTQQIVTHNATRLLTDPVNLYKYKKLSNFQDLNYKKSKYGDDPDASINYHYAISCWVYIDSLPPETNFSYSKYTSLLNIGNKPNILFNVKKNSIMVKMKVSNEEDNIVYKERDIIKMQKWNNIVVNYNGGTLDVFINDELVSSSIGVIPYKEYDIISIGEDPGIHGGICNVMYFNDNLSRNNIKWLYNSAKNNNPPII
jgi:tryptophan-rich sensory protein